jgi:predicted RNA-binding Zn-ribbon protein involved in translation (DUF1610 family)
MTRADIYAELDAIADEAEREYQVSRDFAKQIGKALTDGESRIVSVQDQLHPPCVGRIHTDLGESFPVFDLGTREQAKSLVGKRVKLNIRMSAKGTRYVVGMMALPTDYATTHWPCPKCGDVCEISSRDNFRTMFYGCRSCAYQMEAKP